MLKRLLALLLMTSTAFAQTGSIKSAATLGTEVNTFFLDNGTGQIVPFNARQALLDMISSYSNKTDGATGVPFTPTGGVTSTNVQTAIAELDTKKAAISSLANIALSGAGVDLVTNGVAWTPTITFAVPGDLALTYAVRVGRYYPISSNLMLVLFTVSTASFNYTTASGNLQVTGLPFSQGTPVGILSRGTMTFGGINKIGYSQVTPVLTAATPNIFTFNGNGMNVPPSVVSTVDVPSGGMVALTVEIIVPLS